MLDQFDDLASDSVGAIKAVMQIKKRMTAYCVVAILADGSRVFASLSKDWVGFSRMDNWPPLPGWHETYQSAEDGFKYKDRLVVLIGPCTLEIQEHRF